MHAIAAGWRNLAVPEPPMKLSWRNRRPAGERAPPAVQEVERVPVNAEDREVETP
jgi:hypothetical protein